MLANVRWEVVLAAVVASLACFVVGLATWTWILWLIGLLGLLGIGGDIAWTVMAFARAKRAGESKLKF